MAFSAAHSKQDFYELPPGQHRATAAMEYEEYSSSRSSSESEPPPYEESLVRRQQALAPIGSSFANKTIAIPATSARLGSAFLRAYPPVLERSNISKPEFLQFLDHLNRAIVASPGLRVLAAASDIGGIVPEPTTQVVFAAAGLSAKVGTYAMSKIRSGAVIREANEKLFFPRGLEAQIVKLKTVALLTNMPILNYKGEIDKRSPILGSLQSLEEADELKTISAQQRRLRALEAWISPLEIDELPPVASPSNVLSKVDVFVSEAERKSAEQSMLKKRIKANEKHDRKSQKALEKYEKSMEKYDYKEKGRHSGRDLEKMQERRQKAADKYEKKMDKAERKYQKKDKEEKSVRKIAFLVVVPRAREI
ncbi:hypothetical protein CCMA1212_006256 [Trichoderma ghanense]|uniref:Uncharacterized protein n=1 Tax=Trichoderma ghanense TaxID=65468 RepID=A0ABY2H0Q8_9HYPO